MMVDFSFWLISKYCFSVVLVLFSLAVSVGLLALIKEFIVHLLLGTGWLFDESRDGE